MPECTLLDVVARALPPEPWAEGDNIPWDDPDFSARMLREHLSQDHDLASRRSEIIDRQVDWLHREVLGGRPSRVLDLACGPGLYAHRLARLGHTVVGVDFGPASIRYAREVAATDHLACTFRLDDLRRADLGGGFDLALLLYGQFNVFRRREARDLVTRARAALVVGGRFVLEPQQFESVRAGGAQHTSWSSARAGLFSDRPHLVLHERFWHAERRCSTERWSVIDAETGRVARHAMTTEAYTPEELRAVLLECGFDEPEALPCLPGGQPASGLGALLAARAPAPEHETGQLEAPVEELG